MEADFADDPIEEIQAEMTWPSCQPFLHGIARNREPKELSTSLFALGG
jgi:hypothetical protein